MTNSTQIGLSYDANTLSVNTGVLSAKQGAVSAGTGINISTDSNAITTISAKIDGTTIVVDSATKKLKANYTFMAPLSYNSSTGAVTVGYDNSTIILSSNKLTGNYKAGNGVEITTNTIAAKIDNDTIKFNKYGQLTTSYLFK